MAEFTYLDLRKARESRFDARWKFAQVFHSSEDVIERIETGKQKPTSEQVDLWEELTGIPGLWHRWMCSNDEAYRKRYKNMQYTGLANSILGTKHELMDVLALQDEMERDAIDELISNPELGKRYITEASEAASSLTHTIAKVKASLSRQEK